MDTMRAVLTLTTGEHAAPRSAIRGWAWDQKVPKHTAENILSSARGLKGFQAMENEALSLLRGRQKKLPHNLDIIAIKLQQGILMSKEMDRSISTNNGKNSGVALSHSIDTLNHIPTFLQLHACNSTVL